MDEYHDGLDWHVGDPLGWPAWPGMPRRIWWTLLATAISIIIVCIALLSAASAQTGRLSNCSQTVGTVSAAVPFPSSGATGPPFPTSYLRICDAHASQTLGVNATGATAAIGSAGTLTLQPGGCAWFNAQPVPVSVSVIGSGASTPTACWYK